MSRLVVLALAIAFGSASAADGPESANVRGESTTTRKRLAEVEQKILAGQSADAVDELLRIADDAGDDLVSADGKQFTSARQHVQRILSKLPEAALRRYRDRVEEPAARLLATGRRLRDPDRLRLLLDRYAVSRPAEEAILLIADMAFEQGDFGVAERYWRLLLPDSNPKYPSPRSKPADIEARIVVATIFRGDRVASGPMLDAFEKRYPGATGRVAGRTGPYLETLVALANRPPSNRTSDIDGDWKMLGGSAARDGRVGERVPKHWPARPTWTTPIPPAVAGWRGKAGRPSNIGAVKSLAFHPVAIDRTAYVADAGRVFAFDLRSGARRLIFDTVRVDLPRLPAASLGVPSPVDADFALTVTDGRIVFRFGATNLFPAGEDGDPPDIRPSALIAIAPRSGNEPAALLWKRFPPVPEGIPATWEGAPIAFDDGLAAAYVRTDAGRTIHAIACYRGDGDRPAWTTDVCETGAAEPRSRHQLLTLAGRNIVFCSHSGVVAAVNAKSGKAAWAFRYPRIRRYAADGRHRDLAPSVAADGRVFVAPNDADQLYTFDSESGTLLWSDGPLLFDHLIGAANGKVVAAIAGPQRGLRAYDAATGSCDFPRGWRNHDDPFLPTYGRGLLTDETVLWPTASALYTIRLADGTVAAQPARGLRGNLAFAKGTLLVATADELRGYVVDPDANEPSAPSPVRLGKAEPLPAREPPPAPPIELLPAAIGSPTRLELVSIKAAVPSVNLGEPRAIAGTVRLIRRAGMGVESVDAATGRAVRLPMDDASAAVWCEPYVLLKGESRLSLVDPVNGNRVWSRELADIRDLAPLPAGILVQTGDHTLVALHRATGATAWILNAKNEHREMPYAIESMPGFVGLAVFGDRVLVQRSNGTCWLLDSRDGSRFRELPAADRPWRGRQAPLEGGAFAIVEGPNRLTGIRADGLAEWSCVLGRESSLTGEPADVRVLDGRLYVLVHRNHGIEIECLNPRDGRQIWTEPTFFAGTDFGSDSLAADVRFLFAATGDRLVALRRDTGRVAWSRELHPPATWRVVVVRDRLLVYSAEAIVRETIDPIRSFVRFPHLRRLVGLTVTAWSNALDRVVPIRLVDPRTGDLQQRLDLPAAGAVSVRAGAEGVDLAAGGELLRFTR